MSSLPSSSPCCCVSNWVHFGSPTGAKRGTKLMHEKVWKMHAFLDSTLGPLGDPFGTRSCLKYTSCFEGVRGADLASLEPHLGTPWSHIGAFVSSGCPFWCPFGFLFATQNSSGCCLRFGGPFCVSFAYFWGPLWRTNVWWTKKLHKKGARREPVLRA